MNNSNDKKILALASVIEVIPTIDMENEYAQPIMTAEFYEFDVNVVMNFVKENEKLIQMNAVDEINDVLENLNGALTKNNIAKIDNIQVSKDAISLLRIRIKDNSTKKSINMDITGYKQELQEIKTQTTTKCSIV